MVKIPLQSGDYVHINPAPADVDCDVHDWPDDGLPQRAVAAMKERHGDGGVNVCRECVDRMKRVADSQRFPEGALNYHDEGELQIRMAADAAKKIILVDFGKPVAWLGLPPAQARAISAALENKANEIEPPIAQGTGLMVRAERADGSFASVEIETLNDDELQQFIGTLSPGEVPRWLFRIIGVIRDARLLRG